jgi:hypothetical protein
MMTMGGQSFEQAYATIETAMGCATSAMACANSTSAATATAVAPQPFFETALAGTGYCNGFSSCTAAVISKQFSNFQNQAVWSMWSALDNGGTAPGFNFAHTMLNTAGQLTSGVGVNASVGYGNYNAAFLSLRMNNWKGVTMQQNFTWSKALGTGALVQATSEYTADDPYNLSEMYGRQAFDRKYVYNLFAVYQPPYFKNQSGVVGHLLGGWNFAPIFSAGSGAPLLCNTLTGGGFTGGTGAQGFGGGDGANFFDNESCLFTNTSGTSASTHSGVTGSNGIGTATATDPNGNSTPGTQLNIFSNPAAVFANVRAPILGIDSRAGGLGQISGLPYWNVDLSVKKDFRITERVTTQFQLVVQNLFNHNQLFDPLLDLTNPSSFGVLNAQGNNPRQMEFGLRVSF